MEWGVTFLIIFCQVSKSCFVLFLSSQERTSAVNTISLGTTCSSSRHICKGHPAEGIPANSPSNPNAYYELFKAEPAYTRWGEPKLCVLALFCYKGVRFAKVLIEYRRWIRVLLVWGNQKIIQSFHTNIIFSLQETLENEAEIPECFSSLKNVFSHTTLIKEITSNTESDSISFFFPFIS